MNPGQRKFALTAHITASVGWIGAVAVFLALAVIGWTGQDDLTVRGTYVVMEPAARFVLVPLALGSLLTGIVMSLSTTWGLFRHHWVVLKLLITVGSISILLIYTGTFRDLSAIAADPSVDLGLVRSPSPMLHALLGLLLLQVATVLAVYKPLGLTGYGRRRHGKPRQELSPVAMPKLPTPLAGLTHATPRWIYLSAIVAIGALLVFVILHLAGGGLSR